MISCASSPEMLSLFGGGQLIWKLGVVVGFSYFCKQRQLYAELRLDSQIQVARANLSQKRKSKLLKGQA